MSLLFATKFDGFRFTTLLISLNFVHFRCCLTCFTAIAIAFSEPTINASFLTLVKESVEEMTRKHYVVLSISKFEPYYQSALSFLG